MKTLTLLIGLLCLVGATVNAQESKETAAIKAVIEKETDSFFNLKRKDWEDTWLHSSYSYWSYSDSTGTSFIEGWENIRKSFDDYFRTQVANRTIDVAFQKGSVKINRNWVSIRVYGNGAYARYTQRVIDDIDRDETSQIRILEKGKDGKWRIVCVGAIAVYPKE
ncbi:MAG: hypothetical protein KF775_12370 [Cyclobacteriaceae bacterium]|nr:hypothetical protein [Cyclobacteriaceae bacterium]